MKKLRLLILLFAGIISCSESKSRQNTFRGNSLRIALDHEPSTFIPREVMDYYSSAVLNQIVEGLVGFDAQTLKITPKIASTWTQNNEGTLYTFTIRDDILFHPHEIFSSTKARLLTSKDIVKSFEMACSLNPNKTTTAAYSHVFKNNLKGAKEFLEGKTKTIAGIQVNGNKLTLELVHEDCNFLNKLCYTSVAIVSKQLMESKHKNDVIGTGPFMCPGNDFQSKSSLTLLKNPDYYLKDGVGTSLPYLDSLVFVFQDEKEKQVDLFESGNLDLIIGLPTSKTTQMIEGRIKDFNTKPPRLILEKNALLESHFYYFNMEDERFKNPLVRKAFNYAIDKTIIGKTLLQNQHFDMGFCGIVPPVSNALRGYDFNSVKKTGYSYNPEKARKLLAQAGYSNGDEFGSIELHYRINDRHAAIANNLSKQLLQVLGVTVNLNGSTFDQLNQDGASGNGNIFQMGWAADYASPESFLMNFYGGFLPLDSTEKSFVNKSRYSNHLFNRFFEQAKGSKKISEQMLLFSKAEAELMKDPPIIPLWYSGDINIMQSYVRNFHFNALNYFDFTSVYLKEWNAEEYDLYTNN